MNESIDYVSLFQKNAGELRAYLRDAWPISEERLVARRNYEELLKNMARRAKVAGCDPAMIEPDYFALFQRFVKQNVEAEGWLRKEDNLRRYEKGRTDMQALLGHEPVPESFRQPESWSVYDHAFPSASASPEPAPQQAIRADVISSWNQDTARLPADKLTEPAAVDAAALILHRDGTAAEAGTCPASPIRFSQALAEYLEEDIRNGRNADARSIVELIVQFLIDVMDDPFLHEFDEDAGRRLDDMMPEIPNRKNIPRAYCVSLSARYFYAQEHGWEGLERLTEMRIRNHYHDALSRFFTGTIDKGHYPHR